MSVLPTTIDNAKARLPASYEQAKIALASCAKIDECQDWANKAEALASYAKMADDNSLRSCRSHSGARCSANGRRELPRRVSMIDLRDRR